MSLACSTEVKYASKFRYSLGEECKCDCEVVCPSKEHGNVSSFLCHYAVIGNHKCSREEDNKRTKRLK